MTLFKAVFKNQASNIIYFKTWKTDQIDLPSLLHGKLIFSQKNKSEWRTVDINMIKLQSGRNTFHQKTPKKGINVEALKSNPSQAAVASNALNIQRKQE